MPKLQYIDNVYNLRLFRKFSVVNGRLHTRFVDLVTRTVRRVEARGTVERAERVLRFHNIRRLPTQNRDANSRCEVRSNTAGMSNHYMSDKA